MRARRSRNEWSTLITAFERSGQSHDEFCAKRGLNVGSFRGWLYRIRRTSSGDSKVALVPVDVRFPEPKAGGGELVIAVQGLDVRVQIGADVGYVAALVAELCSRC